MKNNICVQTVEKRKVLHRRTTAFEHMESKCEEAEESFRDIRARYAAFFSCTFYCIYVHDFEGRMMDANNAVLNLLGYTLEEIRALDLKAFFSEDQMHIASNIIAEIKRTGLQRKTTECKIRKKNGDSVWMETECSVIYRRGKPYAIQGIARDITAGKKMVEELHALSLVDELTGLYNRRGFLTLAEQQMTLSNRLKKQMLLLFVDVDDLKFINDTLGHHEGDKALMETAKILRATFRESDIIARIGGDEFAVLAIDTTCGSADVMTKRLRDNLATAHRRNGHNYRLSLSIGATAYNPDHRCSIQDLLASADKRMYRQKHSKLSRSPHATHPFLQAATSS